MLSGTVSPCPTATEPPPWLVELPSRAPIVPTPLATPTPSARTAASAVSAAHRAAGFRGLDNPAAQAVASGLRDAKADNTRRAYASAWLRFQAWAEAGDHPALPATPQSVAIYLGHLAASGRSIAAIQLARSAISHFHAAAGMQKDNNPARHPVVAEAVRGWRNRAPAHKLTEKRP